MLSLHRSRVHHLTATSLLTLFVSVFPFMTIYTHHKAFQPHSLRLALLVCITTSWASNVCSIFISAATVHFHTVTYPNRHYFSKEDIPYLNLLLLAVILASSGCCLVIISQAIWTYIASKVGIIWVLCLAVLGLALLFGMLGTSCYLFGRVMRVRAQDRHQDVGLELHRSKSRHSEEVQLEIDKDAFSPQRIVATIPANDSELVF